MKSDPTFWLLARSSGLTAYALLAASTLAGLVLRGRPLATRLRFAAVTDVHRLLAWLALAATAVHGLSLVLDRTVEITPLGLLVPGLVEYRPLWTGLGVLAAELALVVAVSFEVRKRIGTRTWRRLHYATYGIFAAATVHGLAAGTDSGEAWAVVLYAGATGAVAAATFWRLSAGRPRGQLRARTLRS